MAKTSKEILADVRSLVLGSELERSVSGGVYYAGTRPKDSDLEDIVIAFTAGLPGQIETGTVTVMAWVPDIDPGDGSPVEDGARTTEVERLVQSWADSLTASRSGYLFSQAASVQTWPDPDIHQHFTSLRLDYRMLGDSYSTL